MATGLWEGWGPSNQGRQAGRQLGPVVLLLFLRGDRSISIFCMGRAEPVCCMGRRPAPNQSIDPMIQPNRSIDRVVEGRVDRIHKSIDGGTGGRPDEEEDDGERARHTEQRRNGRETRLAFAQSSHHRSIEGECVAFGHPCLPAWLIGCVRFRSKVSTDRLIPHTLSELKLD